MNPISISRRQIYLLWCLALFSLVVLLIQPISYAIMRLAIVLLIAAIWSGIFYLRWRQFLVKITASIISIFLLVFVISKEFDVPFLALAQVNRGVESQSNKRPGMADIKDSGDIEQDMDVGLLLYREEYYDAQTEARGLMEINVAKNRNGATGTCHVVFEPTVGMFSNKGK